MKKSQFNIEELGEPISVKLSKIKPYHRNVRDNNQKAVDEVADSIRRYGFQNPILIDKNNVIIAGHTRYLAMKQLGVKEILAIQTDLPENLAREFRAVDNRTHEYSTWVDAKLFQEVRGFIDQKYAKSLFNVNDTATQTDATKWQVTEEQVTKAQTNSDEKFGTKSEERNSGMVELKCPHCDKVVYMKRDDFIKRFVYDKRDRLAGEIS